MGLQGFSKTFGIRTLTCQALTHHNAHWVIGTRVTVKKSPKPDGDFSGDGMVSEGELALVPVSVDDGRGHERLDLGKVVRRQPVLHQERVLPELNCVRTR